MAASILKWVVLHQNYCSKVKGKSKKEEAKNSDPSPKKGTQLRGGTLMPDGVWRLWSTGRVFS